MSRKTRKLMWSAPLVAVLAVAGALVMFVALGPNGAQANHVNIPGAPTDLTVEPASGNAGRTTLVLDWEAPSGSEPVSGYRIDYSADNITFMELVENTGSAGTSYSDDADLGPGEFRVYRVFAVNSAGVGLVSNTASGVTKGAGEPGKVTGVVAMAPTERPKRWHQIDLSWNKPYDGGNSITHYCIEVATLADDQDFPGATEGCAATPAPTEDTVNADTPYGRIVTEGDSTSYSLDVGLSPSDTRLFRVYAVTSDGEATPTIRTSMDPSDTVQGSTRAAENPGAPLNLAASLLEAGNGINLYWNWPASDGGYTIDDFVIQVRNQDGRWQDVSLDADGALQGTSSDATLADDDIQTALQPVADADGLTQYEATGAFIGASTDTLRFRVFTHTDSDGNAVDGGEQRLSSASNTAVVYRDINIVHIPVLAPEAITDGDVATVDGRDTINLAWMHGVVTAGTPPVLYPSSGFRIDYAIGAEGTAMWKPLWDHTNRTNTKFTHKPLDPGTQVSYRFMAYGPNQATSSALGGVTATTNRVATSGAPANLRATRNSATAINLSWQAPENTGGADIENYEIDMSLMDAGGQWGGWASANNPPTTKKIGGDMTAYVHANLDENTRWRYQVRAITDATTPESAWSNTATAQTDLAGKANMPIGLVAETASDSSATAPGDRGVLLMWNASEGPAGAVITHYLIERKVEGEDTDYLPFADTSDEDDGEGKPERTDFTDFDEPDLANGEVRHYRVAAVSGSGTGEWAEVRFPVETEHNNTPMAVGTIPDVTVMVGASKTITMATASYFSDADAGDTLRYSAMSRDTAIATAEVNSDGMIVVTGVAEGMATITVTATDMAGATATQTFMVTVEAADVTLGNAMTLMATQGDDPGDVTLTWDPGANATVHWIAGFRIINGAIDPNFGPIWHAASGDGTHTVNAPAAGEYVFAVIAGRTADGSTEWSRWITQRYTRQ